MQLCWVKVLIIYSLKPGISRGCHCLEMGSVELHPHHKSGDGDAPVHYLLCPALPKQRWRDPATMAEGSLGYREGIRWILHTSVSAKPTRRLESRMFVLTTDTSCRLHWTQKNRLILVSLLLLLLNQSFHFPEFQFSLLKMSITMTKISHDIPEKEFRKCKET